MTFVSLHYLVSDNVFGADDRECKWRDKQLGIWIATVHKYSKYGPRGEIILSGYWKLVTDKGKIAHFTSEFYTGPVNDANNHTHQVTNLRVEGDRPVQLSPEGSIQISGLTDVKTNGKNAWSNVPTTISISKG